MVQWAQVVSEWLKANERSQAWLARKIERNPFYLNRCLHGKVPASDDLLLRIEGVIGKSLRDATVSG